MKAEYITSWSRARKQFTQALVGVALVGGAGLAVKVHFWEGLVLVAAGYLYAVAVDAIAER